jgi:hypothetical protein
MYLKFFVGCFAQIQKPKLEERQTSQKWQKKTGDEDK